MEKGMKEYDIEGIATHGGPESCAGVREDGGEALTGVRAGWAIEPRNGRHPGCRRPRIGRKATSPAALVASRRRTPRGRRTYACAESPCARTGRSHDRPPLAGRA